MITFLGKILVFGLIPVVLGWIAWEEFFADEETLTRPRKNPEPDAADPLEMAVLSDVAAPSLLPTPVFAATPEPIPPQEAHDPRVGPLEHALAATREMVEAVTARTAAVEQESERLRQECASLHSMVQDQAAELARRPEPVASDANSDAHEQEIRRLTDSLSSQAEQLIEVRDVLESLESPQSVPDERMRALEERFADAVRDRSLLHDQVSEVEVRLESRFVALENDTGGGEMAAALDRVQSGTPIPSNTAVYCGGLGSASFQPPINSSTFSRRAVSACPRMRSPPCSACTASLLSKRVIELEMFCPPPSAAAPSTFTTAPTSSPWFASSKKRRR